MLSLLLAVPSCSYSFWHGVIPTSYFIFNDFYTCIITVACMAMQTSCNSSLQEKRTAIQEQYEKEYIEVLSLFTITTCMYTLKMYMAICSCTCVGFGHSEAEAGGN